MALSYPMQTLRVAASTSNWSIMHFVRADGSQRGPTYQTAVRNFASLRLPVAYTVIKDPRKVEHNFVTIIRSRERCDLPMPMEFNPVAWSIPPTSWKQQHAGHDLN